MLAYIDELLAFSKEQHQETAQHSLFASHGTATLTLPDAPPAPMSDMLQWERELLGLYISGHPLDAHKEKLEKLGATIADVTRGLLGVEQIIAGILTEVKPFTTKKGERMAFVTLTDYGSSIECVIFPKTYAEKRDLVVPQACVAFKGRVAERNGERSFIVEKIKRL
jgi:DNA polymerase-3 subunit alpha